jgi:hypothetical protein
MELEEPVEPLGLVDLVEALVAVEAVVVQELQEPLAHLEPQVHQVSMVYLEDLYTI